MPNTLRYDLRQTKPFKSLHEEALLSVARTDSVLIGAMERALAPYGLSMTQYNVLRILRGAGSNGLCRNEIGERLITRTPDVTRLLDRMEAADLVSRVRSTEDRRLVNTTLTTHGRSLVDELDDIAASTHERLLGHLTADQLKTLIDLLSLARSSA